MKQNFKKGFTLIELLVVIAIIGILAAITVVSVQGPRMKAQNTKIISELRQVASVMEQRWGDVGGYGSGATGATTINTWNDLETTLAYLGTPLPSNGYAVNSTSSGYCLYRERAEADDQYIYCEEGAKCYSQDAAGDNVSEAEIEARCGVTIP